MGHAYTDLSFTPTVRAMQQRMGSRAAYAKRDQQNGFNAKLTEDEADFIAQRDGFYQATVSETGWPYVQFRGGPAGFLKVLRNDLIAYADFRGNRQYISTGNLQTNDRVALILVDQATQQRMKIMGHARLVEAKDDPDLMRQLALPGYDATPERAVLIQVEAYDWNCPQHITPRFTEAEIDQAVAPLQAELGRLRREVAQLRTAASTASATTTH